MRTAVIVSITTFKRKSGGNLWILNNMIFFLAAMFAPILYDLV